MAYQELIKSFEQIRSYMRSFYVYGFKNRKEFDQKSARSYDNERRRIESWLGDYMVFRQDSSGKTIFLSVDSRAILTNPFYNAFKAKSFTNKDITFHFYILDILWDQESSSIKELLDYIHEDYFSSFDSPEIFDESTLRKKMKEYQELGLISSEKRGKELFYQRTKNEINLHSWEDAIAFFSEENPLGVIGSFLLDTFSAQPISFQFKHHYILHVLDSQILSEILLAMDEHSAIEITISNNQLRYVVYPLRIYSSTQMGRQYLLCYIYRFHRFAFFRMDKISKVQKKFTERSPELYEKNYQRFQSHLWGVSTSNERKVEHLEMTLHLEKEMLYILDRLEREKRGGSIEKIDDTTYLFSIDVYDACEMIPWLRTFIGKIEKLYCSNPKVVERFYDDLHSMEKLYGDDSDAIQ